MGARRVSRNSQGDPAIMKRRALVWFKRDLRIQDHAALAGAVQARHGSRKSGLPPTGRQRMLPSQRTVPVTVPAEPSRQGDLFS